MKKETIVAKQKAMHRALSWYLALIVAAGLLMAFVVSLFPATWRGVPSCFGMTQHQIAVNGLLALFTVAVVGGIAVVGYRHDIRCPSCGKSIQGGIYAPLALTTGKCGHCGKVIVDD